MGVIVFSKFSPTLSCSSPDLVASLPVSCQRSSLFVGQEDVIRLYFQFRFLVGHGWAKFCLFLIERF